MKLRSYAKINLTLDILRKRKDNYHEIESVFQQINLYDEIELIKIDEDKIELECNLKELKNKNNLAYTAASLIKEKFDIKKGIKIKINKNIPIGAGLSGGSSNAAAVLKGLNLLWNLNLSKEELINLSRDIGADVGFHILGGTCIGRGRGEKLDKLKDLEKYCVVLVYPGFPISTKEAYSDLDYDKIGKEKSSEKFSKNYDLNYLHNDFEYPVLQKYPELKEIKKKLGKNSLLAGSGSSVFSIFREEKEAKQVYDILSKDYKRTFFTVTLNKKIGLAKEMGFCFGVKRAIEEINKISKGKKVYVFGRLIHNPQVIARLEKQGMIMIDDFRDIKEGTIVISAHGIADKIIEEIKDKGLEIVDLTCPLVKKVHDITKEAERKGNKIIVFGDEEHTEVKGIVGNLKNYKVIKNISELTGGDLNCRLTLVSQTTRDVKKFGQIAKKIKEINKNAEIKDTICLATKDMQKSSIELAKKADIMIVIGGKMSSNTVRLKEICSQYCETKHIETEKELKTDWFLDKEIVGITAGASTAHNTINKVKERIEMIL